MDMVYSRQGGESQVFLVAITGGKYRKSMIYLGMVICSSTMILTVISAHKVCVKRLGQTPGWSCLVIYIVPEVWLGLNLLEISEILSICRVDTRAEDVSAAQLMYQYIMNTCQDNQT